MNSEFDRSEFLVKIAKLDQKYDGKVHKEDNYSFENADQLTHFITSIPTIEAHHEVHLNEPLSNNFQRPSKKEIKKARESRELGNPTAFPIAPTPPKRKKVPLEKALAQTREILKPKFETATKLGYNMVYKTQLTFYRQGEIHPMCFIDFASEESSLALTREHHKAIEDSNLPSKHIWKDIRKAAAAL
jgi:hypothetical protein